MKNSNLLNRLLSYSHEKQSPQRFARYAVMLIMLLTLGVGQMWAEKSVWEWKLYYWDGDSDEWLGGDNNTGDLDFGVVTDGYYWKGAWAKTADNNSNSVTVYYVKPNGGQDNFSLTYQSGWDNYWNKFWKNESGCNHQLTSSSFYQNNPGVNTIQFYVQIDGENKLTPKATYTIPGFTNLSTTSVIFDPTIVDSNNSKSITYTHYGTAPTNVAARYSITGTNADQFSITALSGTGATIRFTPTSAGTKTATLVINDVHGKTTSSITLTGKSKVTVTYSKGSASGATGSDVTDDKVYGTNLTLRNSGDFSRTGYNHTAWNTNANGTSGTNYNLGATYSTEAALTLYPTWTAKTTTVTLNVNGATSGSNQTVTATYDAAMPDEDNSSNAINQPSKTGYTYGGYYDTSASSGGTQYYTSANPPASARTWNKDASTSTLYARWTANTYTLTLKQHNGESDGSATATYGAAITVTAPTKTGYTFNGYYTAEEGGTQIIDADGHFVASVASWTNSSKQWNHTSDETLHAQWTAKSYEVTLKPNGATTGSDQTVSATYDSSMPGTTTASAALAAPSKTGYTFTGFWDSSTNGSGTKYYNANLSSAHNWDKATNSYLWAQWSANGYTVTLNVDEANQGTISGATTSQNVTYDGATTTVPNRPTAAQGYALDGYYTDQLGEGTKVINGDGTWIAEVLGYTDEDAKWVHDGDVTLYAYYKKAEITNLVAAPGVIAPGETITITPTIEPTPTGTTKVCWEVQYSNGTPLPSQPTFTPGAGNAVSFPVPSASATYIIQAKLAKGSSCPADPEDVLSTRTTTFQVAGEHTVTIRYQDSDGRTLQASASIEARPLDWTTAGDITPPTITGYTFARWDAGDGVTIKNGDSDPVTTTTTSSIQIKAVYDGTLTAVYNKRNLIYFNNTLGWEHVYVYFYSSDKYWTSGSGSSTGTGASQSWEYDSKTPYYRGFHGEMTRIEGTNI